MFNLKKIKFRKFDDEKIQDKRKLIKKTLSLERWDRVQIRPPFKGNKEDLSNLTKFSFFVI